MSTDNLSAVLHGIGDLRLEQRPIPEIATDEVLLAIDSVVVCESDLLYFTDGYIGNFNLTKPMIIGNGAAGVVAKVGKSVNHLAVGDRVAIQPSVPCRNCDHCKQDRQFHCENMVFCATPPYDGNLTRFYKHAADFCFKLPDHVTMEEGALIEPLSVGVNICRVGDIRLGSRVLIQGAGPIGLVSLLAARALGAAEIVITDLEQQRLHLAKELGATHTLLLDREQSAEQLAKRVRSTMGQSPEQAVLDCARTNYIAHSWGFVGCGGILLFVGNGARYFRGFLESETKIHGVRYSDTYSAALALVASGKVNVKRLVTHHFDISETVKAFETFRYGHGDAIRVLIHVQPRDANNPVKF
ncbi:sorbitol dehydrogenase-like [Drosophila subobscura]|uniref:sorbitol dehydrogenase-like n=1 Tax=Drosophila subobscura TaxID=7241 RepID=UPI00155A76DC|nr:sorbitol dehydrogenase-like [Drosophila subobscura]